MDQYGWIIWIGLMVVFGIAEAATVNMVSVWFVGGSLVGLIVNLLGGNVWLQIGACLVVSGGLLACLRPFVKKYVTPKKTATNADMVLGRTAYLTEAVDNLRGTGALKLDGKEWTARGVGEAVLPEGTLVKIVKLEGVKLYVEPAYAAVQ
ncbi:MAG: NfeD family protein [Oscillospiraceae bacterium]|nr:NfeD family protein [Clostridia bacterium]MBP3660277.1 NfeD family protein [Oscillospiraceae bacterium]